MSATPRSAQTNIQSASPPIKKILWIGPIDQDPQGKPLKYLDLDILHLTHWNSIIGWLTSHRPIAIVLSEISDPAITALFSYGRDIPIILYHTQHQTLPSALLERAVNTLTVYRLILEALSPEKWHELLQPILLRESVHHEDLVKELAQQNRELQVLTTNLESLVAERTFHIEVSKDQESEKLNRMRSLVRFIADLAAQSSLEEVLTLFRKETRKFHKLGDPFLIVEQAFKKKLVLYLRAGVVYDTLVDKPFTFPEPLRLNDLEDSRFFANLFGRPFHKVIVHRIELKLSSVHAHNHQAMLGIEHVLEKEEAKDLVDFISERIQPLSLAIDRILLEHHMLEGTQRWEKTFDAISDPIAIVDIDKKVLRSNRTFETKKTNKRCFQSFANREVPCDGCPINEVIRSRLPLVSRISANGRLYDVHSYPVNTISEETPTTVVNHYQDITLSRELQGRLVQSEKLGAIGLLAGNIAHELNNPLTGLRSLAQAMIADQNVPENVRSDLKEVEMAAERSQKIIRNLLEFSEGNTSKIKISLDDIVNRTLPMLKTALRSHKIEVQLNTNNFLIEVEPNLIQQVVFNLVNNASQALKEAGRIHIQTHCNESKSPPTVEFAIDDSGPGVSQEIREKIFAPFFTTKTEGHGTGLGLSFSKSVIEQFGGHIRVEQSSLGGAKFTFELPIKDHHSE